MLSQKAPEKVTPVFDFFEEIFPNGNKKQTFCSATTQSSRTGIFRFYYKKYSKRLIYYLTFVFRLIYYKQSLYLPTNTMAKKWKHHIKNFGNF